MSGVIAWVRGWVDRWDARPAPWARFAEGETAVRAAGGAGYDPGAVPVPADLHGVLPVLNPENAPLRPPARTVEVEALEPFAMALADGSIVNAQPGERHVVHLWRVSAWEQIGRVRRVVDPAAERAKATMKRAERAHALEQAAQVAAGPKPAPVDSDPLPAPRDPVKVRVKAKLGISLGGGRHAAYGDCIVCDFEEARYRVAAGLCEPVEAEPAEAPAPQERKRA